MGVVGLAKVALAGGGGCGGSSSGGCGGGDSVSGKCVSGGSVSGDCGDGNAGHVGNGMLMVWGRVV